LAKRIEYFLTVDCFLGEKYLLKEEIVKKRNEEIKIKKRSIYSV